MRPGPGRSRTRTTVAKPVAMLEELTRAVAPSRWPRWVLAFRGGLVDDPVAHEVTRARFHRWQAARSAWRAEHTDLSPGEFLQAAARERQRRRRRGSTVR